MENKILNQLIELNIVNRNKIISFYPKVRDREDVSAFKCEQSGVVFLSSVEQV
jgi:hypothetical protein